MSNPVVPSRRTVLAGLGATALTSGWGASWAQGKGRRPNILFVSIDDLNDWTGVLGGHVQAKTPNLDKLAGQGMLFENAHCAAPACNPSRVATLLGKRPSSTGIYNNQQSMRAALPDAVTLPQQFRAQGYKAMASGKIFHVGDPDSWDVAWPDACSWPPNAGPVKPKFDKGAGEKLHGSFAWGPSASNNDGKNSDDRVADWVIKQLKRKQDQPFFLGCGFFRPHLPWFVPQKYFDMYPLNKIVLPTVMENDLDDIPASGKRMARIEQHQEIVKEGIWASAVQAYLASLTFADVQLGRVLSALADSDHARNTIVVAWSDHGWSLGEKMHWKKFALWEECTRIPLVIKAPGITTKGSRTGRAVSLVDVYPTLCELAGIDGRPKLEGNSLVPLIKDPSASWSGVALTTQGRRNHAVRDDRYRYIRYADGGEELYDHKNDPHEFDNLAKKGLGGDVIARLKAHLPKEDAAEVPEGREACGKVAEDDG